MDKDTKAEFEKRDLVLDGLRQEIDSLTGSLGDLKNETETEIGKLRDGQSSLQDSIATSANKETAVLHEQAVEENARLNNEVARLSGPGHENEVIQSFLRKLDADNFHAIGIKLGYLEDTEAGPEDLENVEGADQLEVSLGDNKVLKVSKKKPEDMTGWEYSETQDCYIKVE